MKRPSALCAAFLLAFLVHGQAVSESPAVPPDGSDTIRVGAFNIQNFGAKKAARPNTLAVLARVALAYDALAIEEVGSNGSQADEAACRAVLDAYVGKINEASGADSYAYVQADQFAVVYRKDSLELLGSAPYCGTRSFAYTPLTAFFRAVRGNFDFVLVVVHVRPSRAASEIPALKTAMAEAGASYGEPDVACLGDFNADGRYYPEGEGDCLAGFPRPDYITVIPNWADTTVSRSSNAYDRIELTASLASDYSGSWGVVDLDETCDVSLCEGSSRTAGTEAALSDHYPVWARFYTDRDAD